MAILVSGGAGYIGSHTCVELLAAGYDIVVADNCYNSCPEALARVKKIAGKDFRFVEADMTDKDAVEKIFAENEDIDCVIQFAAYKAVGESVSKPIEYYSNNLACTLNILDVMRRHNCHNIIFSSSATVYGDPASVPIREDFPVGGTTNPYGTTKVFTERILTDCCHADPELNVALLRYFNPIGAHRVRPDRRGPQRHPQQPRALYRQGRRRQAGEGPRLRQRLPDPRRHRRARLHPCCRPGPRPCCCHQKAGAEARPVHLQPGHRPRLQRAGRHQRLRARPAARRFPTSSTRAAPATSPSAGAIPPRPSDELGWEAQYGIEEMCAHSWNWQSHNPDGYKTAE